MAASRTVLPVAVGWGRCAFGVEAKRINQNQAADIVDSEVNTFLRVAYDFLPSWFLTQLWSTGSSAHSPHLLLTEEEHLSYATSFQRVVMSLTSF